MFSYYLSKIWRPVLEYPTLTEIDSALLEIIQMHALKTIYRNNDDYSIHLRAT